MSVSSLCQGHLELRLYCDLPADPSDDDDDVGSPHVVQ